MTDQTKKLDSEIASLEASIAEKAASLKVAQTGWNDWRVGNLRAAIGHEQVLLHSLMQRTALAPLRDKRSTAIFYGSNN